MLECNNCFKLGYIDINMGGRSYLDLSKKIGERIAHRLCVSLHSYEKEAIYSFVYNNVSYEMSIVREGDKRLLKVTLSPREESFGELEKYIEDEVRNYQSIRESPSFKDFRDRFAKNNRNRANELQALIPLVSYRINGEGFKGVYEFSDGFDIWNVKETADLVYDALRIPLRFSQKIKKLLRHIIQQ